MQKQYITIIIFEKRLGVVAFTYLHAQWTLVKMASFLTHAFSAFYKCTAVCPFHRVSEWPRGGARSHVSQSRKRTTWPRRSNHNHHHHHNCPRNYSQQHNHHYWRHQTHNNHTNPRHHSFYARAASETEEHSWTQKNSKGHSGCSNRRGKW